MLSNNAGFSFKVTKDFDGKKIKELAKRIKAAGALHVRVGLPDGKTEEDGTPLTMLGFVHEFGLPQNGIPERSFMRSTMREQRVKYARMMGEDFYRMMEGKITAGRALGKIGVAAAGDVQAMIEKGDFVPLKEETIERKGSSEPLIDTGTMRQNIAWSLSRD